MNITKTTQNIDAAILQGNAFAAGRAKRLPDFNELIEKARDEQHLLNAELHKLAGRRDEHANELREVLREGLAIATARFARIRDLAI